MIVRAVTVKLCWTWGAALKLALPAWLASRMQVPAAEGDHAAGDGASRCSSASTVMVTARPEVAGGGRGVGGAAEPTRCRCRRGEGDGLGALHAEGLLGLGRRVVVGVAGLVGVDDAGAAPTKVKTDAVGARGVQTVGEPDVKVTVRPEGPWRPGCRWRRRRWPLPGAVEVKVMVWVPLPTVKVCWTWGAAL